MDRSADREKIIVRTSIVGIIVNVLLAEHAGIVSGGKAQPGVIQIVTHDIPPVRNFPAIIQRNRWYVNFCFLETAVNGEFHIDFPVAQRL
jgi:hypothetical protein